jgi:hypothetical protein
MELIGQMAVIVVPLLPIKTTTSHHLPMPNQRKKTAERFAKVLSHRLIKRFGSIPSAARLAQQFNLRASEGDTVSPEAARRWIKGISVPELARFRILSDWLNIDAGDFLDLADGTDAFESPSAKPARTTNALHVPYLGAGSHIDHTDERDEKIMLDMFRRMSRQEKNALVIAMLTLADTQ